VDVLLVIKKKMIFKKNIFWNFISLVIGALLFFGGLGVEMAVVYYFGVLIGFLMLVLALVWRGKLKLPNGFFIYVLFLVLFLGSLLWSHDAKKSFEYFALFLGGGLFWLASYNLKKELGLWMDKLVVVLGLVFGGLFIFSHYFGEAQIRPWSLYLPYTAYLNHNNIGDFWAVVLTVIIFYILKKPKNLGYWLLAILGAYFLLMSQSRSAYVVLAVGVVFLFTKGNWHIDYKKIFAVFILLAAGLFILTGASKTTLLSRPYFVQALLGFVHNPWGVGIGNFGIISSDSANHIWGLSHFSSNAHNIVLEIMTGMGIFGLVFVAWLFKIIYDLWLKKFTQNLIYQAVFFALATNFFFHSTYFVPTMLWLWFMVLGLAQADAKIAK
jgi:O-antigen ligase